MTSKKMSKVLLEILEKTNDMSNTRSKNSGTMKTAVEQKSEGKNPSPRYISTELFRNRTQYFDTLKGFSAEEGRRDRKAKILTNLGSNNPWNNFLHVSGGCPAAMVCVTQG